SVAALNSAKAQLDAAQAQVDVAANASQYAELKADVDGLVVNTAAEPGQVVTAGQTVVQLAKDVAREAAVELPETLRPALQSRADARLYGNSG
ncbi:HlyD family efflux transporter periplasmic adaptor subunit, partial [Pseudomonas viridiflava]|uniref:HlyD family efflux transporter periplasmic adaptor subunit n=1 Tax=Pseudomonas viridiflava TaxID=33069 RepID=UPI000F04C237